MRYCCKFVATYACFEQNIALTAALLQILSPGDTRGVGAFPADMFRVPVAGVAIRRKEVSWVGPRPGRIVGKL
jgi:hypothetical protein